MTISPTAQAVQSHDFSSVGDGYAVLQATGRVLRGSRLEKFLETARALREQVQTLQRIRDERLVERLRALEPLPQITTGQSLGLTTADLSVMGAQLAEFGIGVSLTEWTYMAEFDTPSLDHMASQAYVSVQTRQATLDQLRNLNATVVMEGFGFTIWAYPPGANVPADRQVVAFVDMQRFTISPADQTRLLAALDQLHTTLANSIQQSAGVLAALEAQLADDFNHADTIDTSRRRQLQRHLSGLSPTP